jgi:hypothetical protein
MNWIDESWLDETWMTDMEAWRLCMERVPEQQEVCKESWEEYLNELD